MSPHNRFYLAAFALFLGSFGVSLLPVPILYRTPVGFMVMAGLLLAYMGRTRELRNKAILRKKAD
jgi:hypothetical protein